MKKKILTGLITAVAAFGASSAPASAHLGDWWTQQGVTNNYVYNNMCVPQGCIYGHDYHSSGPYGEHSRWFKWHELRIIGNAWYHCYHKILVGHTYSVFGAETTSCISD